MTDVEFVMAADVVVMSTFSPLASFSSMPMSSTNAPRVPEPSSREYTETSPVGTVPAALSASPEPALPPPEQPMRPNAPSASRAPIAIITKRFFMLFLSLAPLPGAYLFASRSAAPDGAAPHGT